MTLLVVGSVALDSVFTPFGETADALGGSAVHFAVAASLLHPVRVVGVIGDDYPVAELERLAHRGIDWSGVQRVKGESFRWKGKYSYDMQSRETLETRLGVFANFKPVLVPAAADAKFVFLGNIDPVLQLDVLRQLEAPALVAADTMNLWINIKRDDLVKMLGKIHTIMLNDEEARQLAGEHNLARAAKAVLKMGPSSVIIKRGDAGALLFHGDTAFAAPAMPLSDVLDPTGAGDSFAGGLMGYLAYAGDLSPKTIRTAMILGSVMGSFAVEKFSVDGLRGLDAAKVQARFNAMSELVRFEHLAL